MAGELLRIDSELAEAIAREHDLIEQAIEACSEGLQQWYVSRIADLADAQAIIRRLL